MLPWVSNLGADHFFGTIFEREDEPGIVMFLADCADPAITLQPCKPFLAMDGTGTYGVQFRDAFVPDELILAEPAGPFVKKIRAGFILLQAGMALGLIRIASTIMDEVAALARPRQPLFAAAAGPSSVELDFRTGDRRGCSSPAILQCGRQLLAPRRRAAPAHAEMRRRRRACGDALTAARAAT